MCDQDSDPDADQDQTADDLDLALEEMATGPLDLECLAP
jgi:hypothetical protein